MLADTANLAAFLSASPTLAAQINSYGDLIAPVQLPICIYSFFEELIPPMGFVFKANNLHNISLFGLKLTQLCTIALQTVGWSYDYVSNTINGECAAIIHGSQSLRVLQMNPKACNLRIVGQALALHNTGWVTGLNSDCVRRAFDVVLFQVPS